MLYTRPSFHGEISVKPLDFGVPSYPTNPSEFPLFVQVDSCAWTFLVLSQMMQRRFDSKQNVWENPRTCEEIVTVPKMANHNQLQTLTCLGASELHPKGHRSGSHQPQPASALSSPMETCNGSSKHQVWKPKLVEPSTPSKHMGSDRAQGAREAINLYIDYIFLIYIYV